MLSISKSMVYQLLNSNYENNRIFFNAYLLDGGLNHNEATTIRSQSVRILIKFSQQFVLDNNSLSQISPHDGPISDYMLRGCDDRPLRDFDTAEDARPVVKDVLSEVVEYFANGTHQLRWGGYDPGWDDDRLQGFRGVADRLSQAAVAIVRRALAAGDHGAGRLTIVVGMFRRTVTEAVWYKLIQRRFGTSPSQMFETARYNGGGGADGDGDLECAICLREVLSGAHVARLPCAHRFHENCIVPWLEKSQTCPLCRFSVRKKTKRTRELFLNY